MILFNLFWERRQTLDMHSLRFLAAGIKPFYARVVSNRNQARRWV